MFPAVLAILLQAPAPAGQVPAVRAPIVKQLVEKAPPRFSSSQRLLPPPGSAWVGEAPHEFLDGAVTLFCGSHGNFSGQSAPPEWQAGTGATATQEYAGVFTGELSLRPPVVPAVRSFRIETPIRMSERMTLFSILDNATSFVTELTAIEFTGERFPAGVKVRESPGRVSQGRAMIRAEADGSYRVAASYSVWLEISLDGGRSWHPAGSAVRMHLEPEAASARLSSPRPAKRR